MGSAARSTLRLALASSSTLGTAGGAAEQTRWSVRCDWLHRLHHRSIAPLVDFGIVGETSRFEAWRCTEIWQGSPDIARAVRERADRFFRSNALTARWTTHTAVYSAQTGAVVLPDTGTGYRSPVDPCCEAVSLNTCGISVIARPIVAALAEMFRAPCGDRPHVTVLVGPAGSGRTTIVGELARTAAPAGLRADRLAARRLPIRGVVPRPQPVHHPSRHRRTAFPHFFGR